MSQHLRNRLGSIRQLRVFLSVYELGSVTLASQVLNLTQPTVSIQLRQLTELIGMPLYHVVGKKLIFTQAADTLAKYANELLDTIDRLEIELADLNEIKAGTLKVAVVTSAKYFIPHLLGSFCRTYPQVDILLKVDNRGNILARYHQGLDDIYLFSHLEPQMEPYSIQFLPNRLYPVAPKDHPLAHQSHIEPEDLLKYPWLSREPGSGTRHAIDAHFKKLNLQFKPNLVIESNEAIKHCVIAGMGLTILSEYALEDQPGGDLVKLSIAGFPILSSWHIVQAPLKHQTPLGEAFIQHATEGTALGSIIPTPN
ncbi:LysR family transcriptional regulator [Photobacterium gaetbulicola]|uniref:Putative LysR family transcriptional regulator n=1 Tax=Photobacterium gaetbulicola Gung47 TaxID=658445 RepID=A0A0C5WPM8_9GAMM|nr:LysR family transcriptional regulator [Photobacterium gaetbulicola]AJR08267.1 putative LysR family transcriptional regulator [Photobacterium gaetbulicola Gung47]PSU09089.1 LysR family transcriptional regulator [Photobacterium gaetbulicola]